MTTHFSQATDLASTAAVVSATAAGLVLCGYVLASPLRRPWGEGQALGLLTLIGCADVALYLSRHLHWNLSAFAVFTAAAAALVVAAIKWAVFRDHRAQPSDPAILPVFIGLSLLLTAVRLMTPFPQAGYSVFQALYPAYIDLALAQNSFPDAAHTGIGAGFIARNHLAYPADTLGLAALAAFLTNSGNAHAVYLGSTIATGISIIALYLNGCKKRISAILFIVFYLLFLRYGNSLRLVLLDNWIDVVILYAGGVFIYFLMNGDNRRIAVGGAIFAASFMVFSRPYGLFYAALAALIFFIAEMRRNRTGPVGELTRNWRFWAPLGAMTALFGLNEIHLVWTGGIYHAQPFYANRTSAGGALPLGTIMDFGLLPDPAHFQLPIPMAGFAVAALIAWAYRMKIRKLKISAAHYAYFGAPFILLLGPFLLELATGYRRGSGYYNKLYIVAQYVFMIYPVFVLERAAKTMGVLRRNVRRFAYATPLAWAGLLVTVAAVGGLIAAKPDLAAKEAERITGTYGRQNVDYLIGKALNEKTTPEEYKKITDRKILYVYHEPGLAVRYYIGGNLFDDYDFWGPEIQKIAANSPSLADFLRQTNYPVIWLSFPDWTLLGDLTGQTQSAPLTAAIQRLDETSPLVETVFRVNDAVLIVTKAPDGSPP